MIKDRDPETVAVFADAFRNMNLGNQGVGFIRQTEDQIGFLSACIFVGIDHGDTVEQMPGVDNESRQSSGQQAGSGGQQRNSHILHGACINKQAHGGRPEYTKSALLHQDTETKSQEHIAGHNGNRIQKRGSEKLFFQVEITRFLCDVCELLYEFVKRMSIFA